MRLLLAIALLLCADALCAQEPPGNAAAGKTITDPKLVLQTWSEEIRAVTYTSDGKHLVVSPKEDVCWIFDANSGDKSAVELKSLRGPTNFLLAGKRPETVYCVEQLVNRLVDIKTGKDLATHGVAVNLSPCGGWNARFDRVYFGTEHGGIGFLPADLSRSDGGFAPAEQPKLASQIRACAVAYSADGTLAASARPDGRMFLWSAAGLDEKSVVAVSAHEDQVDALEFTSAGLVSLGRDGRVKRWSTPDAKELATYSIETNLDRGWLLANGRVAVMSRRRQTGELEFYEIPGGAGEMKKLVTLRASSIFDGFPAARKDYTVQHIALSPDGTRLATAVEMKSKDLVTVRLAIFDVSSFMPKPAPAAVASTPATGTKTSPKTSPPKVEREFREWNTADGQFKVEAQFLGKTGDTIRLKRKDTGKVITVPLEKFSEADQAYVRGLR